jgi:hypothetical protein
MLTCLESHIKIPTCDLACVGDRQFFVSELVEVMHSGPVKALAEDQQAGDEPPLKLQGFVDFDVIEMETNTSPS